MKLIEQFFAQVLPWLLALLAYFGLTGCLTGCAINLEKRGEFGFRMSNDFAFYHEAPDSGAKAEANLLPPMWELVDKWTTKDGEQQPAPAPSEPTASTPVPGTDDTDDD